MISRSLFAVVLLASSALAGPPLTTIQDVLYKADGTRFAGTLTISWTSFESIDKSAIVTQSKTVTVTNGQLFVQLVPTTTAVPAASYTVKYNSDGYIQFSEIWAVPYSTTPLRVRDVHIVSSQADTAASDSSATPAQESDVAGLISDLGARPLKGPGYAPGRVAMVDAAGSLESVTGIPEDCVRVDGSSGPCGGSQPAFVDGESPAGIVDGSNDTFTLLSVPDPLSSLTVYLNGVLQKVGQDYNISGTSIEFVAAAVPQPGDTLLANYRIQGSETLPAPPSLLSPQQIDPTGLTAGQSWLWNGSSYVPGSLLQSTDSYSNPAWIASLAYAKITGVPSFEPAVQAGTPDQYWRGDKHWQTLNAAAVANAADTTSSYTDPAWLSISKAGVGLGNVENTALSTWAGTSSLTTIGTLAAGTVPWARLSNVPANFAPVAHAATHAAGGSDAVTPAAIGAVASSGKNQPNGYVGLDGSGNASIAAALSAGVTSSGLAVTVAGGNTPLADGSSFTWSGATITLPANKTLYLMANLGDGSIHALPYALDSGSVLLATVTTGGSAVASVKTPLQPVVPAGYIERTKAALARGQAIRVALIGDSLTECAGSGTCWVNLIFDAAQSASGYNLAGAAGIAYDNYALGGSTSHYGLAVVGRGWYGSSGNYDSTAVGLTPYASTRYSDPPMGITESPVLHGYDLVILNYGTNGGTAWQPYLEATVRDIRRSGAECIIHTGSNRTDNIAFADPAAMGWLQLAKAYGCAIADTWSYGWERENVYATNAHADAIHPNQLGHNAYAASVRGVINTYAQRPADVWPISRARMWHDLTNAEWQRKIADLADVQFTPFYTNGTANSAGSVTTAVKNPAIAFGGKTASNYITSLAVGQVANFAHPFAQSVDLLIDSYTTFTAEIRRQNSTIVLATVSGGQAGLNRIAIVEGVTVGNYADMSTGQMGLLNRGVQIVVTAGTLRLVGVVFHTFANQELQLDSAAYAGTWGWDTATSPNPPQRYTDTIGDTITIPFRGCGLVVIAPSENAGGIIDYWLDGVNKFPSQDMYSPNASFYYYSLAAWPLDSADWFGSGRGCGEHVAKIKLSGASGAVSAPSAAHHRLAISNVFVIGDR